MENWIVSDLDEILIKVKCKNIMNFSSYIDNIVKKQNIGIDAEYYYYFGKTKNRNNI